VLYTGNAFDPEEIESALEAVTAKTVREVCTKYIYDKCPAVVGYGEYHSFGDMEMFLASGFADIENKDLKILLWLEDVNHWYQRLRFLSRDPRFKVSGFILIPWYTVSGSVFSP